MYLIFSREIRGTWKVYDVTLISLARARDAIERLTAKYPDMKFQAVYVELP